MRKFIILFLLQNFMAFHIFSQEISFSGSSFLPPAEDNLTTPDGVSIDSISYFDLGGHLFAGRYPINNPVVTGDTGIVYLYMIKDNIVVPVDTSVFYELGYFLFPHIAAGSYIVKARLTENSPGFALFFPTYLNGGMKWNQEDIIDLTSTSEYEANIHLLETPAPITGPASLKGYVVQETTGQIFRPMGNTEVILMNEQLIPITYCFSDSEGWFRFPNLPYGTYNLMAEATGKYPAILKITLDQHHTTIDSLLLETMMHNPATIEQRVNPGQSEVSSVFPDPATDRINVTVKSKEPLQFNFSLYTLNGEQLLSHDQTVTGITTVSFPVGKLQGGLYFLKIVSEDGKIKLSRRWVKL